MPNPLASVSMASQDIGDKKKGLPKEENPVGDTPVMKLGPQMTTPQLKDELEIDPWKTTRKISFCKVRNQWRGKEKHG